MWHLGQSLHEYVHLLRAVRLLHLFLVNLNLWCKSLDGAVAGVVFDVEFGGDVLLGFELGFSDSERGFEGCGFGSVLVQNRSDFGGTLAPFCAFAIGHGLAASLECLGLVVALHDAVAIDLGIAALLFDVRPFCSDLFLPLDACL
ncbi:hypothetical protein HG530_014612 [Fusarium avenaceum]|nr:hypothetical protein HG530_014612 [Fusarium avenaceum]